jgi:hypothetical protein
MDPAATASDLLALPAGWEAMLELMRLPEEDQISPKQGGDTIGGPLGLRSTVKNKGMYGGSKTNMFYDRRYTGVRYGRQVSVHPRAPMWPKLLKWGSVGPTICTSRVIVRAPRFTAHSRRGILVGKDGCDALVLSALEQLSHARRWSRLRVHGDAGGIAVTWLLPTLRSQTRPQWPYHLWLAERLADRLGL